MASITGIKRDMAVLGQTGPRLSPFGLLSEAFAEEIRSHAGGEEGFYDLYSLDFLEENGEAPEDVPALVRLYVDLKLVLQQMKEQGQSGAARRIVEKALSIRLARERSVERQRRPVPQTRLPWNRTAMSPVAPGAPGPGTPRAAYRGQKQRAGILPRHTPPGGGRAGEPRSGAASLVETFHRVSPPSGMVFGDTPRRGGRTGGPRSGAASLAETFHRVSPPSGMVFGDTPRQGTFFRGTPSGGTRPGEVFPGETPSERAFPGRGAFGRRYPESTAAGKTSAGKQTAFKVWGAGHDRGKADRLSTGRPGAGPETVARGFSGAEMVLYREPEVASPFVPQVNDGGGGTGLPQGPLSLMSLLLKRFPTLPGPASRKNGRVEALRDAESGESLKQTPVSGQIPRIQGYSAFPAAEPNGSGARENPSAVAETKWSASGGSAMLSLTLSGPAAAPSAGMARGGALAEAGRIRTAHPLEVGENASASGDSYLPPTDAETARQMDGAGRPAVSGGRMRRWLSSSPAEEFPLGEGIGRSASGFHPAELEYARDSAALLTAEKGMDAGIGFPPLILSGLMAAVRAGMTRGATLAGTERRRTIRPVEAGEKAPAVDGRNRLLPENRTARPTDAAKKAAASEDDYPLPEKVETVRQTGHAGISPVSDSGPRQQPPFSRTERAPIGKGAGQRPFGLPPAELEHIREPSAVPAAEGEMDAGIGVPPLILSGFMAAVRAGMARGAALAGTERRRTIRPVEAGERADASDGSYQLPPEDGTARPTDAAKKAAVSVDNYPLPGKADTVRQTGHAGISPVSDSGPRQQPPFSQARRAPIGKGAGQSPFGFPPAELEHIREPAAVPAAERGMDAGIGVPPLILSGLMAAVRAGMAQGAVLAGTRRRRAVRPTGTPEKISASDDSFQLPPEDGTARPTDAAKKAAASNGGYSLPEKTETVWHTGRAGIPAASGGALQRQMSASPMNQGAGAPGESRIPGGLLPMELEHRREAHAPSAEQTDVPAGQIGLRALEGAVKQIDSAAAREMAVLRRDILAKESKSVPVPRKPGARHPGSTKVQWPAEQESAPLSTAERPGSSMPPLTASGAAGPLGRAAQPKAGPGGSAAAGHEANAGPFPTRLPPPLELEYAGVGAAERPDEPMWTASQRTPAKRLEALARQMSAGEYGVSLQERRLRSGASDRGAGGDFPGAGQAEGTSAAIPDQTALPPVMRNLMEKAAERWAAAEGGPMNPMAPLPVELDHAGLAETGSSTPAGIAPPGPGRPAADWTASLRENVRPSVSQPALSHPEARGTSPQMDGRPARFRQAGVQSSAAKPADFHRPAHSRQTVSLSRITSLRTLGTLRVNGAKVGMEQQAAYPALQMTYASPAAALTKDLRHAAETMGLSFPAAEAMAGKAEPESMQTLNQMSQPQIEEQIVWQNPYMRAGPVDTVHRQKPAAARREQPQPRISDAEIRRTADKVFKMVQEKILAERRRIGRV